MPDHVPGPCLIAEARFRPHTTVHGVPGIAYTRRTFRLGQHIPGTDGRDYVVTGIRDDGDLHGDGCPAVEVHTELAPQNLRVCQG